VLNCLAFNHVAKGYTAMLPSVKNLKSKLILLYFSFKLHTFTYVGIPKWRFR
jgi:hypothetical protein